MKYVEASQFGGPEVLTVVEKETPTPGDSMLLVEVQAAGINYTDVAARKGLYPAIPKAPFTPGLEVAGILREVGKDVQGFKTGDTVAAITAMGGGYASHLLIPAATAIPFPKHLDPALVAGVLVQGLTAYLVLDQARVKSGDAVLITAAAGGVGSLAVQLAKARGAKVIGLASESKFDLVKGFGADHVIDYGNVDWAVKVSEVAGSQGVQVFLDSIGDLASEAFPLLSQFGRWVIYRVRADKNNALPRFLRNDLLQNPAMSIGTAFVNGWNASSGPPGPYVRPGGRSRPVYEGEIARESNAGSPVFPKI